MNDGTRVPYVDGKCKFLDGDRCTLWGTPKMPRGCRGWDCATDAAWVESQPDVLALLTREGIPLK